MRSCWLNWLDIEQISMLGHEGALSWEIDDRGLQVSLPVSVPSDIAVAFKIALKD